jgi:hypothetical protein
VRASLLIPPLRGQLDPNCSKREAAQSKSSPCHLVIAVGDEIRSTRTFIQRELRIRLWCETRLRTPYPAIKPRANTGVINSTSWTTKTSCRWGLRIVLQMRRSCSEECPDFMHCVEISAIQLHKQNPPSERGTDVSRDDGSVKLVRK